jgi:hypothetical protein
MGVVEFSDSWFSISSSVPFKDFDSQREPGLPRCDIVRM